MATRLDADDGADLRPMLRGWLHLIAAPVVAVAGMVLLARTQGSSAAALVYAVAATGLFTISALYHRRRWGTTGMAVISRVDHSMIFVIIAASYTPVALAVLPPDQARALLIVVWFGAILGVVFRVLWFTAPRWLYTPLYLLLGYAVIPFLHYFVDAGPLVLALIVASGLCYTSGAVVYGLRRPDPLPRVFGFHEVFHSFTIVGWGCHFAATWLVLAA